MSGDTMPFAECNNCGRKPTLDELEAGDCPKCGDTLIVYSIDVAKYIKTQKFSLQPCKDDSSNTSGARPVHLGQPDGQSGSSGLEPYKTPGQIAYENDCAVEPNYHTGHPRGAWHELSEFARQSWERNPTRRAIANERVSSADASVKP